MSSRAVTLHARLSEIHDDPLPGSRHWVANAIESARVEVGYTKHGSPAVWLVVDKESELSGVRFEKGHKPVAKRAECLAAWFAPFDYGTPEHHHWPFEGTDWNETWGNDRQAQRLFGVVLHAAGEDLLRDFARKCRTLLRLRLRRENRVNQERLTISLTSG
jgi:hypothetical protein